MTQTVSDDVGAISDETALREAIRRRVEAAGTSFYWAMRLLPKPKRQAMFAVYAFCRVVDDIADGDLPTGTKLSQLQGWRDEIGRLYAGNPRHPVARALQAPVAAYDLAREDFLAIIDGMEMDARGPIVAPPLKEFRLYCARVAGAVCWLLGYVLWPLVLYVAFSLPTLLLFVAIGYGLFETQLAAHVGAIGWGKQGKKP